MAAERSIFRGARLRVLLRRASAQLRGRRFAHVRAAVARLPSDPLRAVHRHHVRARDRAVRTRGPRRGFTRRSHRPQTHDDRVRSRPLSDHGGFRVRVLPRLADVTGCSMWESCLLASAAAIFLGGQQSSIPHLVGTARSTKATAALIAAEQTSNLVTPPIGGAIFSVGRSASGAHRERVHVPHLAVHARARAHARAGCARSDTERARYRRGHRTRFPPSHGRSRIDCRHADKFRPEPLRHDGGRSVDPVRQERLIRERTSCSALLSAAFPSDRYSARDRRALRFALAVRHRAADPRTRSMPFCISRCCSRTALRSSCCSRRLRARPVRFRSRQIVGWRMRITPSDKLGSVFGAARLVVSQRHRTRRICRRSRRAELRSAPLDHHLRGGIPRDRILHGVQSGDSRGAALRAHSELRCRDAPWPRCPSGNGADDAPHRRRNMPATTRCRSAATTRQRRRPRTDAVRSGK